MPPGPWTPGGDTFLYCAYHVDHFPAAHGDSLGVDPDLLRGRNIGSDFSDKDGFNMYHGSEGVPGFPQHPHRGFETVTLMRQGLVDHADSMGCSARFGDGDTQWVTTGRGIMHSEMMPLLNRSGPNVYEGFQVWLNLPRRSKMSEPHFTMFWREHTPRVESVNEAGRRTQVTLVAGELSGRRALPPPPASWASSAEADVAIMLIELLEAGATFTLPPVATGSKARRQLYLHKGAGVTLDGVRIQGGSDVKVAIELSPTASVSFSATEGTASLLLLQGAALGEPVAKYGPFVMNTREEIAQAFADFRSTQFGGWPHKDPAPVHARDQKRFAKHADGRTEHPEGK